MALPTLEKTWQYNVNQTTTGVSRVDCDRNFLFAIKQSLVGFASNPWTVVGSSNSTTAGMDAVDRWSTAANVVWGATGSNAFSWIVLRQNGVHSNFQLLLSCGVFSFASNTFNLHIVASMGSGFTGGSTTVRPTATDEVELNSNNSQWQFVGNGAANTFRFHVMQSDDGQCTRLVAYSSTLIGSAPIFWLFDRMRQPISQISHPVVMSLTSIGSTAITYSNLSASSTYNFGYHNGLLKYQFTGERYLHGGNSGLIGNRPAGQVANDFSAEWPLTSIGLYSPTTTKRGRHGEFFDLYWGPSTLLDGDTFPSNGTKQLVEFGDLVFPWNGSTPILY